MEEIYKKLNDANATLTVEDWDNLGFLMFMSDSEKEELSAYFTAMRDHLIKDEFEDTDSRFATFVFPLIRKIYNKYQIAHMFLTDPKKLHSIVATYIHDIENSNEYKEFSEAHPDVNMEAELLSLGVLFDFDTERVKNRFKN